MEVKEAIEFLKYHISDFKERTSDDELFNRDKCNKFLAKANSVISLLKRGEAFEQMWNDLKWNYGEIPIGEYKDILNIMTIVAHKYFYEGEAK